VADRRRFKGCLVRKENEFKAQKFWDGHKIVKMNPGMLRLKKDGRDLGMRKWSFSYLKKSGSQAE
jgi:hypothetical protein